MHQSYLVAAHGSTAVLCGGTSAVAGHGNARREAHELHGDQASLARLPRLGRTLQRGLSACAVVGDESTAVLRVMFRAGEATIRSEIMLPTSTHPNQALT